jgi:phage terminase small subunit
MKGRPRKPIEQHKLDGTYREDRQGNNAEPVISQYLEVPKNIDAPVSIIDDFCREHYKYHVRLLANLKILTLSDIPEIDMMYEILQEYRKTYNTLQTIDMINDNETYEILSNRLLKYGNRFSVLASKYCISPTARNKLTLESLSIKKEIEHTSLTTKLLNKKKS